MIIPAPILRLAILFLTLLSPGFAQPWPTPPSPPVDLTFLFPIVDAEDIAPENGFSQLQKLPESLNSPPADVRAEINTYYSFPPTTWKPVTACDTYPPPPPPPAGTTAPPSQDWLAVEDRMPQIGEPDPNFYVAGRVTTNRGNIQPRLAKTSPQGFNPAILLLNLTLVDLGGIGTQDVSPRDVRYEESINPDQYTAVSILWEGNIIENIPVTIAN